MILATYGMKYITMEADCQAYILAKERTSVPMCGYNSTFRNAKTYLHVFAINTKKYVRLSRQIF